MTCAAPHQSPTPSTEVRPNLGHRGFYRGTLLPKFCAWSEANPELDLARQRAVEYATGHVLELGSGIGSTLDLYPHEITSLTTVDPNPALNARLRRRMRHLPFPTDVREGVAEQLPVKSAAFDTVVSVFALGAVDDLTGALGEIRRVLKPGGRLLVAELAFDADPVVARRQQRLTAVRAFLGGGYRLLGTLAPELEAAGLHAQRLDVRSLARHAGLLGTLLEALAVRAP